MDAQETSIFTAVLTTGIIVLVLVIFFTITVIRYQRKSLLLYKAKLVAEITTLENERKRVAADLHDEIGPIIAGIKLKINSLEVPVPEDQATLSEIHDHISTIIGRMKDISADLMPVVLLKKGLVAATEKFIDDINRGKSIHISFHEENTPPLPEGIAINLYRILQEVIHNAIKHSSATELNIDFIITKNHLVITTTDNGSGFDYKMAARENAGLGLRNLLSRTEVLNGKMYVESAAGKGTRYTFDIPV